MAGNESTEAAAPSGSREPAPSTMKDPFHEDTSRVILGMLKDGKLSTALTPRQQPANKARVLVAVSSPPVDAIQFGMIQVLQNKPEFHFRQDGISTLLNDQKAFEGVSEKYRPAVASALKDLHLAQALAPTSEALPVLLKSRLSASRVAQLPAHQFVEKFGPALGGSEIAENIHQHAVRVAARNDHVLTSMIQSARGTGLAAIDGNESREKRMTRLVSQREKKLKMRTADAPTFPEQINLEKLFGSLDYCECSDCTSVTSPAAYFVELLQFLRNNNLDPDTTWSAWSNSDDFSGSPLDYLFRRRPDLACLELTCANTNLVLPYIDLANEVMESFIYHRKKFISSTSQPKQSWLDIFNAADNADGLGGSTEELLAVPQNVNMKAYEVLKESVYPAAQLPYNQPIDAIRQLLSFLQTSRSDVIRIFQSRYEPPSTKTPDTWSEVTCPSNCSKDPLPCPEELSATDCCYESGSETPSESTDTDESINTEDDESDDYDYEEDYGVYGDTNEEDIDYSQSDPGSSGPISAKDQATLTRLHQEALKRAVAAEELGITQDEYIILTKQAFWEKLHFDLRHGENVTLATYRKNIGVKKDWEYWGLDYKSADDMKDTKTGKGLAFVKQQLLPRTGIKYSDLADVVRTNFMNPNMLKGRAKVVMDSIRFSYQLLASKIDTSKKHQKTRIKPLLEFLENPTDVDPDFQKAFDDSLKKITCCQIILENRFPPNRDSQLKKIDAKKHPNNHKSDGCMCGCDTELRDWICTYFESVGKIIVLDAGEGQKLPWEGDIFAHVRQPFLRFSASNSTLSTTNRGAAVPQDPASGDTLVGHIHTDGSITVSDKSTDPVGYVSLSGVVYDTSGQLLSQLDPWKGKILNVVRTDVPTGKAFDGSISGDTSELELNDVDTPTPWTVVYDDCDLTKVKLQHLDGKSVTRPEFDKMHRFLRLWRKLGWTIQEVDAAISAFGSGPKLEPGATSTNPPVQDDDVDYGDFQPPCDCNLPTCDLCSQTSKSSLRAPQSRGKYCSQCGKLNCKPGERPKPKHCNCHHVKESPNTSKPTNVASPQPALDITPYLITQVAALNKIINLTGMSILQVLTFWTDIDTHGDTSLYAQLFLTHNMLGIDRVFVADTNGNYLTPASNSQTPLISQHRPILLAAFQLKAADLDDIIRIAALKNDDLTLENVSAIYRHSVLANMLSVRPKDLDLIFKVFQKPWTSAEKALELLTLWTKVTDAGFSIQQLAFIFKDIDNDPLARIGPSEVSILQLAASLYTNLKDIDSQYPLILTVDDATSDAVTAKAQLLFGASAVADILGFLQGTRLYVTNAPKLDNIDVPKNLRDKFKYLITDNGPTIQSIGQLTGPEISQAYQIAPQNAKWVTAINRLSKQALTFFNTTIKPVFPDSTRAANSLVSGDVRTAQPPDTAATPPLKRFFFLENFIPFLRKQLTTQAIVSAMASASSLPNDVTTSLLQDILKVNTIPAMDIVEAIKNDPSSDSDSSWSGYLVIATSDKYTFFAESTVDDDKPQAITIDGHEFDFSTQQDDPTNVWYGEPISLTGGKLYKLVVKDQTVSKLKWKTDSSIPAPIPSSSLIPAHAEGGLQQVLPVLMKAAIFINGFGLSANEVSFFQNNAKDFAEFDWNKLTLNHWKRINKYALLKSSLPKTSLSLLDFFAWAGSKEAKDTEIPKQIQTATLWKAEDVTKLIAPAHFNLSTLSNYRNEIALTKIQEGLNAATKIGVDIDKLFDWGKPVVDFEKTATVAADIKTVIRSRFTLSDWDKAIKPTYDVLRQNQSNALVAYLVVQPNLVSQGVIDADSLFEFFLIDPSICPCMDTSRLKQATSSVQLFIQRCLLGLENQDTGFGMGVDVATIDRDRWKWMQRYRLWEANRKVYLYPENWIMPSLRDDKSSEFKALESELLQGDITEASVLNAMKNYLFAVDGVSNLRPVAVYIEDSSTPLSENALSNIKIIHFFGRSAVSPYKYYYRTFDAVFGTWTPWSQMQIDVPNYEIERKTSGGQNLNGCYVVPFMFNGRLIVGLPQFLKKQIPAPVPAQTFTVIGQGPNAPNASDTTPSEYWEIKLGYTELLNGTWKAKVVSTDAIQDTAAKPAPEVSEYQFVPEINAPIADLSKIKLSTVVHIDVLHNGAAIGRFDFNGSRIVRGTSSGVAQSGLSKVFQYADGASTNIVTSLQKLSTDTTKFEYSSAPSITYPADNSLDSSVSIPSFSSEPFNHQFMHALMSTAASATTLDGFFGYFQNLPTTVDKTEAWGGPLSSSIDTDTDSQPYNELYRTYSLYNWEMTFHAPMLLADKLLETQQFDLALQMCHYVFDPYATGAGIKRYWKMPAFSDIDSIDSLEKLFAQLQPRQSVPLADPINQWRDDPFQPHVLARLRPVSYMKWTVMKYIEILIAYGDWYFQQNTLEMIPMAIQMYVLASHVYGPRGQMIPKRGKKRPETYMTLLNKWDAFGNAMVQLELEFPFSNQIGKAFGNSNGVTGLANIFGFATNRYFCIPNNDQLAAVRDKIDDRLFKIRHCQDINGVFRSLPLYEPPLDVGQLVAAAAAGISLQSLLNDLNATLPNYRFLAMLSKALELCSELKSMGGAFLAANEKQDGEALSVLRQKHDLSIQNLVMEQKKLAVQEAQSSLDTIQSSRARPEYQMKHTLKLLGADPNLVPTEADDFQEITDDIPAPVQDSGMLLSAEEAEEIDKAASAKNTSQSSSIIQAIGSDLKAFPTINGHASPFGVGVAACFGPGFIGDLMMGVAQVVRITADGLSYESTAAGRKNGHNRTRQERVQTANSQGYELKNIDKQIVAQNIRIQIANQEITNQQKQIDNAQEVLDFLTNKYTNAQLYSYMSGRIRTLYYQTYQLAYSWARKAEMCYRFERGEQDTNFIQSGYWEPGHDGLLSGESLYVSLKNMEAAYHESRGYDFEITKVVSLRLINPLALLQLRENGSCEFGIPEVLFDMDFPGHYMRTLKSVALTLPCLAGPYTNVNCTMRLTTHKVRFDPTATDRKAYPEKSTASDLSPDKRFATTAGVPITAVAICTGTNDAGGFDAAGSGSADRFAPFEGAGAISQWSLTLPPFRQFDYSTIQDVVLHLRYTSRDGGGQLAGAAAGAVDDFVASAADLSNGLFAIIDARAEFGTQWGAFLRGPERTLSLPGLQDRLPVYTRNAKVVAQEVWVVTDAQISGSQISVVAGNKTIDGFTDFPLLQKLKGFAAPGPAPIADWTLKLAAPGVDITRLWVLMRYTMKIGNG